MILLKGVDCIICNRINMPVRGGQFFSLFLLLCVPFIFFTIIYFNESDTLAVKRLLSVKPLSINILMVLESEDQKSYYQHAIASVQCYANIHGYRFSLLVASDFTSVCPHKDKFFRRHCVSANVLNHSDYTLFLDADMGVVNPKRRIEQYIEPGKEIIFYDRFYNFEIMAGSYLARNSEWTRMFLMGWANYEFRLPNAFHGTDNGAIHAFILEVLFPERRYEHDLCLKIYNNSVDFESLFAFEACARILMGRREDFGLIRILGKGKGWARDNWLTNSKWTPERDFIIHSWKLNQLREYTAAELPITTQERSRSEWYNPIKLNLDLERCVKGNTTWNYDGNLIASEAEINEKLDRFYAQVEIDRIRAYAKIAQLLKIQ